MKRRYDVPQGRTEWVVEEKITFADCPTITMGDWTFIYTPYVTRRPFASYSRAAAYFVKRKLQTKNDVRLVERRAQDFSMWRKR